MQRKSGLIIKESAQIALASIAAHKLRTFLTLLGIIIGVASVMVVGAGIEGLETYVNESVADILGSNSFIIAKFANVGEMTQEEYEKMLRWNKDIRMEDFYFVSDHCPDCEYLIGELNTVRSVFYEANEVKNTNVTGSTSDRILIGNQEILEGRYFNDQEVRSSRYVCVIGWELYEELFQETSPLGKVVRLGNEPFTVIGVLDKMGSSFGQSLDNEIHIPITAFQKTYGTRRSLSIRGTAANEELFEAALGQAHSAMRVAHKLEPGEDDTFQIISTVASQFLRRSTCSHCSSETPEAGVSIARPCGQTLPSALACAHALNLTNGDATPLSLAVASIYMVKPLLPTCTACS